MIRMLVRKAAVDTGTTVAIVVAVAAGTLGSQWLQRRRNQDLATRIEPLLRERGALTMSELAQALGMSGFYARGKVLMALGDLVNQQRVQTIPAPEGTPQLQKVKFIKYQLRG
jgi:hypothetical protein